MTVLLVLLSDGDDYLMDVQTWNEQPLQSMYLVFTTAAFQDVVLHVLGRRRWRGGEWMDGFHQCYAGGLNLVRCGW